MYTLLSSANAGEVTNKFILRKPIVRLANNYDGLPFSEKDLKDIVMNASGEIFEWIRCDDLRDDYDVVLAGQLNYYVERKRQWNRLGPQKQEQILEQYADELIPARKYVPCVAKLVEVEEKEIIVEKCEAIPILYPCEEEKLVKAAQPRTLSEIFGQNREPICALPGGSRNRGKYRGGKFRGGRGYIQGRGGYRTNRSFSYKKRKQNGGVQDKYGIKETRLKNDFGEKGQKYITDLNLNHERHFGDFMPDVYYVRLMYWENDYKFDLGTTDNMLLQDFVINNPYDPSFTVGGKKANGFVQLMGLYRYCRVSAANIYVTYSDVAAANICPIQTALIYNSESAAYSDFDSIASQPRNRRQINQSFNNRVGTSQKISGRFYPCTSFGMDRLMWKSLPTGSEFDITNLGSIVGPVTPSFVSFYYARVDDTSAGTAIAVRGTVKIEYDCVFRMRLPFNEPTVVEDIGKGRIAEGVKRVRKKQICIEEVTSLS
jgi:hypothetical protein